MTRLNDRRILKAAREKQVVTYKEAPIRLSSDYSTETFQARRDWHKILKVMKTKDLQPRLHYPARISLKNQRRYTEIPIQKNRKAKGIS